MYSILLTVSRHGGGIAFHQIDNFPSEDKAIDFGGRWLKSVNWCSGAFTTFSREKDKPLDFPIP